MLKTYIRSPMCHSKVGDFALKFHGKKIGNYLGLKIKISILYLKTLTTPYKRNSENCYI